jgi:predicted nucleic acid-binding Zn ribbon protein
MEQMMQPKPQAQPALLADALAEMMGAPRNGINQRYEAASRLSLFWADLLPPALAQHCRVVDLSAGTLTVEADSPSYLYELRISSHQLIQYLRQGCPLAKVRDIKVILAR